MSELLTKNEWREKQDELIQSHAWLKLVKNLELAPGWRGIIKQCMDDIQNILQHVGLESVMYFGIYVRTGRENSLKIYAEFNPKIGQALIDLCNDRIQDALLLSKDTCRKCGDYICDAEVNFGRRTNAVCKDHSGFEGVYAEDFAKWKLESAKALAEQEKIEVNESEFDCENELDEIFAEATIPAIEESVFNSPSAKLYDMEELLATKTNKSNDRHVNERRKEMIKQMEGMGENRNFCEVPDAAQIAIDLKACFPNFTEVIDFIETYLLMASSTGKLRIPTILLEGPPGIGKTAFAKLIAKLLNTGYIEIHMENEQSNSTLAGSSEFWGNSQYGTVFDTLVFGNTINPIIVIDEVDKVSKRVDCNPLSPLYQLLERDTAMQFRDNGFRSVAIDASHVIWILTANDSSLIDAPILSRMKRFDIKLPTPAQAVEIAKRMYVNVLKRNEWIDLFDMALPRETAKALADLPPRQIQAEIEAALGRAAKAGRKVVQVSDIDVHERASKRGIGFLWHENKDS